jgi:hypothetical protein
MNWYFEEHGVIKGPFPEGDFAEMVRRRDVPADALVWRPGLEEWATAQEINPPWLKNIASGLQPARQQQGPGAPKQQVSAPPKEQVSSPPKDQAAAAPKLQVSAPTKEQVSSAPKDQVPAAPKLQVSAPTKEQVSSPPKDQVPVVTKLQVSAPTKEPASSPAKDEATGASKEQADRQATTPTKESLPVIEGAIPNQAAASTPARTAAPSKFKPMAPIPSADQNQPAEKGGLLKRVFGIGGKQKS